MLSVIRSGVHDAPAASVRPLIHSTRAASLKHRHQLRRIRRRFRYQMMNLLSQCILPEEDLALMPLDFMCLETSKPKPAPFPLVATS